MRMYFELEYEKSGVIGPATVTERQTYYPETENIEKKIRANLAKAMNLMGKQSGVYLRIGKEETVAQGIQKYAITQSISDTENDVYNLLNFVSPNEKNENKVGGSAVKKMVLEYFKSIKEESVPADNTVTDTAGDGTPLNEVMAEIIEDEKKAKRNTAKKDGDKK